MERGTACPTSPRGPIILGHQVHPSLDERLDAARAFVTSAEAAAICRWWGLADGFSTSTERYAQSRPTIQDAFYDLDNGRRLTFEQREALTKIVGPLDIRPNQEGRVLVHVYQDPSAVFAQTLVEADLELRTKPSRLCAFCKQPIPDWYRADRRSCSDGCQRSLKREYYRKRYQPRTKSARP